MVQASLGGGPFDLPRRLVTMKHALLLHSHDDRRLKLDVAVRMLEQMALACRRSRLLNWYKNEDGRKESAFSTSPCS